MLVFCVLVVFGVSLDVVGSGTGTVSWWGLSRNQIILMSSFISIFWKNIINIVIGGKNFTFASYIFIVKSFHQLQRFCLAQDIVSRSALTSQVGWTNFHTQYSAWYTGATVDDGTAPCMGMSGVGGCSNGSADPLSVKPDGVQHCRKQFRFFPCCHLKDGTTK